MNKLVGYRKVLMVGMFFGISANFVNLGTLEANVWMTEMVKLLIAFVGANLSEHVASAGKAYFQEKSKRLDKDIIDSINKGTK